MVVLEIYTYLKGRQNNKRCPLKKFDFSNRINKVGRREYLTWYQSQTSFFALNNYLYVAKKFLMCSTQIHHSDTTCP